MPRAGKTTINLCSRLQTKIKNNQPVWPVAAATRKQPTKQNNNHPVWRPVTAHVRKQEKTQSSCAAACHVRKRKKQNNNQAVRPLTAASKKRTINLCGVSCLQEEEKQQSTGESGGESRREKQQPCHQRGKTTINLCSRPQTNKQKPTTINRCGLLRPQQEKTSKAKQQSSCVAGCHGPWPQARKPNHPVRRPVTAASKKTKQQSSCAASHGCKQKQNNQPLWRVASAREKNNQAVSREASQREKQPRRKRGKTTINLC